MRSDFTDAQLTLLNMRKPEENYSDVMWADTIIGIVFICAHYI